MGMVQVVQRKIRSLFRYTPFTRLWFIPVLIMLGVGKVAISIVPFRHLVMCLGEAVGTKSQVPLINSVQQTRATQISRVVSLAARYTPWDSNCFPQAVAACILLKLYRVPYALYFGLLRLPESGEFKAHAWVTTGRIQVTGGRSFGYYTVVGCFIAPNLLVNS